ncbi:MAG: hypothetical protein OXM61_10845 [Candidatus Poribacteria bacterium]|nr:hypothetical protein [Candidatus Poribacteria bacterium]
MKINLVIQTLVLMIAMMIFNLPITVIGQERQELQTSNHGSYYNIGIFGTVIPGTEIFGHPGYQVGWSYELPTYAVEAEFRIFDSENVHFGGLSVGSIFYLSRKNISSYVGGGVATTVADHVENSKNGVGVYAVFGTSFLRSMPFRLKFEIRLHRPFYTLETQDVMPIMVGFFFSHRWSGLF